MPEMTPKAAPEKGPQQTQPAPRTAPQTPPETAPEQENLRKNFLWNTAGSLLYFAAQWLFTIVVWRADSAARASYFAGLLNTATAVTNMFLSLASYGMYNYQASDVQQKYAQSVYVRSRHFTCLASAALCAGYLGVSGLLGAGYTGMECLCVLAMLGFRLIESTTDVYNAIHQKCGRLDIVGKTYAARGILSLGVFVGVLWTAQSLLAALAAMTAANLVFFFLYTKRKIIPFYTKTPAPLPTVSALLLECLPLAVYSFLSTTAASIPKLALKQLAGAEALGVYGSVTAPVLLLQVGATYLFTPFITVFARRWAARDRRGFVRAVLGVEGAILLLLPLGLLVADCLGAWGLATFVDASLASDAYLLGPMVVSAILTASVLFFSMVLTVMRCMKELIWANVCGMAAAAAVCVPCIRAWGMQGTTWAAVIALGVQLALLVGAMAVRARRAFAAGPAVPPM